MSDTPEDKKPVEATEEVKATEATQPQATDTAKKAAEAPVKEDAKEVSEASNQEEPKKKVETAADLLKADLGDLKIRKAKGSKNIISGICHVLATYNNTIVTFTDKSGNTIAKSSSGKCGFRSSRKSTAYAAQVVSTDAAKTAMSHGLKEVEVRLKGPGMGRDNAVRALQSLGIAVTSITDVTPIAHNGCRPRKRRRG